MKMDIKYSSVSGIDFVKANNLDAIIEIKNGKFQKNIC